MELVIYPKKRRIDNFYATCFLIFDFPFFLFGENIIAIVKNIADIRTIEAPIGKSDNRDSQKPTIQLTIPIIGENIKIFLKSKKELISSRRWIYNQSKNKETSNNSN